LKIINVVGARPNFIKKAPLIRAMSQTQGRIEHILVHTGQHYDNNMFDTFFSQVEIPEPDISLGVGSASHAEQSAKIVKQFEELFLQCGPDMTVFIGNFNPPIACYLVVRKAGLSITS